MTSGRSLIGVSAVVVGGTLSLAEIEANGSLPGSRQWVALSAAYLLLGVAADLGAEGLGGGLALLLMVATILVRGDDVLAFLGVKLGVPQRKRLSPKQRKRVRPIVLGPIRQVAGGGSR